MSELRQTPAREKQANELRQTPVHAVHVRLGARMVPFAGYDMPVQYEGILAEARAVRSTAGVFDVSHMGRITVDGTEARALLDWVHTADIGEAMPVGRARYGVLCDEDGGIIDDGIVYRLAGERFMLATLPMAAVAWFLIAFIDLWFVIPLAAVTYAAGVWLLRAFSPEDVALFRDLRRTDPVR